MRLAYWATSVLPLLVGGAPLFGGTLGLKVVYPDIVATNITVSYDLTKTKDQFQASGTGLLMGLDLDGGGDEYFIKKGKYTLAATIDTNGSLVDGSLSISGILKGWADPTTVVYDGIQLTGKLTEFGYDGYAAGAYVFEFRFDVTGGYLHDPSLFRSKRGGIIISGGNGSSTDPLQFGSSFGMTGARVNTFVPTPMALPAGLALMIGMMGYRRFQHRRALLVTSQDPA